MSPSKSLSFSVHPAQKTQGSGVTGLQLKGKVHAKPTSLGPSVLNRGKAASLGSSKEFGANPDNGPHDPPFQSAVASRQNSNSKALFETKKEALI